MTLITMDRITRAQVIELTTAATPNARTVGRGNFVNGSVLFAPTLASVHLGTQAPHCASTTTRPAQAQVVNSVATTVACTRTTMIAMTVGRAQSTPSVLSAPIAMTVPFHLQPSTAFAAIRVC